MNKPLGTYWYLLICVLLISVTFAVYWPVVNHEFVKYDDDKYVTDNREVKSGLSWQGIRWAFTTGHASNWHPVTWLALAGVGKIDEAIKEYQQALAINPDYTQANEHLKAALAKQGKRD